MKKILSSIFAILLVVSIVSAGIGIGAIAESRDMDKAERDMLLSKTDAGEINPIIEIKCSDDYCIWSAVQKDIINSKDNKIQKYYMECLEFDEELGECTNENRVDYTDTEIKDKVADAVASKLSNYAKAEISRDNYEDWGTGTLTIGEKK